MNNLIVRRVSNLPGNASPSAKQIDRLQIDRDAYADAFTNGRTSWFEYREATLRLEAELRKPGLN